MKVPFNDLLKQYHSIKEEIDRSIFSIVERSAFINSQDVFDFEQNFARMCGGGYCIGCSNGTDALELALRALRIGAGDEVIVPTQSFIASIEPVITLGGTPVFVDIDPKTYCIDPTLIENAITVKTKAIIAVHLYGHPCDMDPINAIAKKYRLAVIEDACQAHIAEYKGVKTGLLSDIATFSFYPGKNLGAFGDAGAVVTRDVYLSDMVSKMTNHGRSQDRRDRHLKYQHSIIGFNSRLDSIQAAVLNVKIRYLEKWTARRREIASMYSELLSDSGIALPSQATDCLHSYHLYVVKVKHSRDAVIASLLEKGISTGIHYPDPLHLHKPVRDLLGDLSGKYPVAEDLAKNCISLPIYPEMSDSEVVYVAESLKISAKKLH